MHKQAKSILNAILTIEQHNLTQKHFIAEFIWVAVIAHHIYIM